MNRDLFVAGVAAGGAQAQAHGVPLYRGRPLARREHLLDRPSLINVLTDTADRIVVCWRLFAVTDTWDRVPGTDWFERSSQVSAHEEG